MPETWLTIEKVCAFTGWSEQHVRRIARAWTTRSSESRGRNGKPEREYPLSSLPANAQAKFAEQKRKGLAIVHVAEQTLPLFASVPALQSPPRVAIPEDLEDQARARLKAIEPYLDVQEQRKQGRRTEIRLANGKIVRTMGELAEYIGSQQNPSVSASAIWEWVARFNKGGYAALADQPRKDRDKSRFFEEHAAAALFLQKKFLKEGLSREMAWEALVREWKKIEKKGEPPCYDTARNFLNALPEPMRILAREGKEAHERKCSPFIQRSPMPAMDWWVADHRQFDVMVRNSLFAEMKSDQPYRLWMTAIYDWGSRKIVGFSLAPTPSSRTINSALRVAVLSHGFPRNFYWDNGEDFKKVRRDLEALTLSDEAQALLQRERIGITSALPKRPRSKPIESWFARWSKRFDVLWGASYLGNKPGNRSEAAREAEKQHAKFMAGKRSDSPLPTDAEFISATVQFAEEYNDSRLEALDHRTPNEVMEEAHPERKRSQINPRLLDILFCERAKRVVLAGGCVQLDGMRYEPTDESLYALDVRKGQQVTVLRDPYNLGEAIAADSETLQFIGELRIQEFIAQCPNGRFTRDQIKAAMRRERGLRRGYADYLALLSALASNQGWKTEREALVERAIARTGTDDRLLPAVVPGALGEAPRANPAPEATSIWVNDAAAKDRELFAEFRTAETHAPQKASSPFVSDKVKEFLAEEPDFLVGGAKP